MKEVRKPNFENISFLSNTLNCFFLINSTTEKKQHPKLQVILPEQKEYKQLRIRKIENKSR